MNVFFFPRSKDFLDSCRANTLLAELDDEEDLPEPDDDDDENEDDNQEDQEYEEVLVRKQVLSSLPWTNTICQLRHAQSDVTALKRVCCFTGRGRV